MTDREKLFAILKIAATSLFSVLAVLGKSIPVNIDIVNSLIDLINQLLAPVWPLAATVVAGVSAFRLYQGKRQIYVAKNQVQSIKAQQVN